MKPKLSGGEWTDLYKEITSYATEFCTTLRALKIFLFIINRTIRFKKLDEHIKFNTFQYGSIPAGIGGTGLYSGDISLTITVLIKANLIYCKKIKNLHMSYRINVIGILEYIIDLRCSVKSRTEKFDKQTQYLQTILVKLEPFFGGRDSKLEMPGLREKALESAKKSKDKKRTTRSKQPLRTTWLKDFFKECCEENEIGFSSGTWTQKNWGQAKNYLKECDNNGFDPRVQINLACQYWTQFQYKLLNIYGKEVHLYPDVNWQQFYLFRRPIMDFIKNLVGKKVVGVPELSKDIKYFLTCTATGERYELTQKEQEEIDNELISREQIIERKRKCGAKSVKN